MQLIPRLNKEGVTNSGYGSRVRRSFFEKSRAVISLHLVAMTGRHRPCLVGTVSRTGTMPTSTEATRLSLCSAMAWPQAGSSREATVEAELVLRSVSSQLGYNHRANGLSLDAAAVVCVTLHPSPQPRRRAGRTDLERSSKPQRTYRSPKSTISTPMSELRCDPRPRAPLGSRLGKHLLHDRVLDVVVGVDLLDIVEVVESLDQSEQLLGIALLNGYQIGRQLSHVCALDTDPARR